MKSINKPRFSIKTTPIIMKVTTVLITAIVAAVSVNAAAAPKPVAEAEARHHRHHFCYRPGEPCSKLKRAAEAVADALAAPLPGPEADARHRFCYRPGEPCSKAKRDALALAEAVAEAHAAANPSPEAGKPFQTPIHA